MEYQKTTNLLDNIPDKVPKFITKNGQKFMISRIRYIILITK